jgi:alpha-L-fucosidase 2
MKSPKNLWKQPWARKETSKLRIKIKKMKTKLLMAIMAVVILFSCAKNEQQQIFTGQNLVFNELASSWDEAMPLGNGIVGNLVWQKNGKLRFSLDRADLWDLRPMANIDFNKWKFDDVYEHWKEDKYEEVQNAFDVPYNKLAAPSKIPAGALEFDIEALGKVKEISLDIKNATCTVIWESGTVLTTFVHAEKPIGWYIFENLTQPVKIEMKSPAYNRENEEGYTSQSRNDLNELGYPQGVIEIGENSYTYNQKGWGDFAYQIHTSWEETGQELEGCWSVSSENKNWKETPKAIEVVEMEFKFGVKSSLETHLKWWEKYWSNSRVEIPDSLLQKQYYLEMYKFGAAARADAPPIALQSVWTADHGKLPPWKGDFHHDLNTQLSYWPAYAGNQLELEEGFLNWLWKYRPAFKKYTKEYFGVNGMNVPGVTTLEGEPMGGWIQYSFGQTVAAWLSHHFYLHWQFTLDRDFLKERAYPWLKEVSVFLDEVSVIENGKRKLKISSSPEIFNNSKEAWFAETTNFDLALIRWNLEKSAELAKELGLNDEAERWTKILSEWPELAVDEETGFMFAPGFPYHESHRHFSHLMAFHPLNLVDISNGEADKKIIQNTLSHLAKMGSDWWTGYSFSWQGNLYARAFEGEKAAEALRIFAECFCLQNSFHVNGDQCKAGHSKMTYRPFTLEGNFAFASAIQEMLIQSHAGNVKLFPAIPNDWNDVSFENLRTYGAFLVSAKMEEGQVMEVRIVSEKGGTIELDDPFQSTEFSSTKEYTEKFDRLIFSLEQGEEIVLKMN